MRYAILYGPHLYASCLFALVASPVPVSFSLKVLGVLLGVLSVLFLLAALVDYIYEEIQAREPEDAPGEIYNIDDEPDNHDPTPMELGQMVWDPARKMFVRKGSAPVKVDDETHAVTWPDATITTTPEERKEYIGDIF